MTTINSVFSTINMANEVLLYIANNYIKNPISLKPIANKLGISQDEVINLINSFIQPLIDFELDYKTSKVSGGRYAIYIKSGIDQLKTAANEGGFYS